MGRDVECRLGPHNRPRQRQLIGHHKPMKFRLFEKSDLPLYLRWVNQRVIWEVDNSGPFEIRTAESFADQWNKIVAWKRSWMIESDGREIGYIGFISDEKDALTDEFFIVIGETSEWRKGHGAGAMEWLFQTAKNLGLTKVTGQVLGNNQRALAFYERLGFSVIAEQDPKFERNGKTYSTLLIEKPLG